MALTHRPATRRALALALVAAPLAALVATANAEDRKFVVFLADPAKDHPGAALPLPNRNTIYDHYFDKVKNGQNGGVRIDSHAEWWEEVSYGDVTVSGEVFGWVSVPWPTRPPGFNGNFGFGSAAVIPHVDLQGADSYSPGSREVSSTGVTKFEYDFDGVGENLLEGNGPAALWFGFDDVDNFNGAPLWAQGERFLDLNGNNDYDAGVFEWGIDKNGNGRIDVDKRATSAGQLFAAVLIYPDPQGQQDDPVFFNRWSNDTEWWDANGDGQWNLDHFWDDQNGEQVIYRVENFRIDPALGGGFRAMNFYRGDWGGRELWVDADVDNQPGAAATPDERVWGDPIPPGARATLLDWMVQVNDPENPEAEYYDEQRNGQYDFPEPFEDYMRRWDAFSHQMVPTSAQYIRNNYPGDAERLIARTGNGRYDSPDWWSNNGQTTSSNKMQYVVGTLLDAQERAEQNRRNSFITGGIDSPNITPLWWETFWTERFGTAPPAWQPFIPYLRKFDPGTPVPQLASQSEQPQPTFEPNRGGEFHTGRKTDGTRYVRADGTIKPDPGNRDEGLYDGFPEYVDLPSSIYHAEGDQDMGEVTSPNNNQRYGSDEGSGPNGAGPDGFIEAGGPLAFNVHGDGGWDGGNVLNAEFATWRTDGTSLADEVIDTFLGPVKLYHRDVNLDGFIDLGETPGMAGDYALPDNEYSNYGVDPYPGTTPNGGPQSVYPWNRLRLCEDVVAALDDATDWNEFLGGAGPFGNVISGLILLPDGTAEGMFFLPAADLSGSLSIRVRDGLNPTQVIRRDQYSPIPFFDGLGIATDSPGEGELFGNVAFQTPFAAHEYGHSWEGYPDLYDYDVWRNFPSRILNTPVGRWCVMAGGGLVHPVPILKQDSGWIQPVDITNALNPLGQTTLEFRTWEFDRDKTVFTYTNPLYASEQFYLWRQSPLATNPATNMLEETFDKFLPGRGLMILHVDRAGNPNGLPPQQRLSGHFTYLIVQGDGLHHLEADNGGNSGDAGDPWPGSAGATTWTRFTDPSNKWYTGEGSGLDISNIVEQAEKTLVTFNWTPRELPSFSWVQPPGGTSVNGTYTLKYFAFDQHGGTRLEFYVDDNTSGYDGVFLSSTTKPPGDIDGAHNVNIGGLPDGTYSFYARLVPGQGMGGAENAVSKPRPNFNNQGNGSLNITNGDVNLNVSRLEVWTVRCVDDSSRNRERWSVSGSVSGNQSTQATTGQQYQADPISGPGGQSASPIKFTILGDTKRFRVGDQFTFVTTGLTAYSESVLIFEGEIVPPQPPVAVIESVVPATGLANWTEFTFTSASFDPANADITEVWNFGDGSSTPPMAAPSTVKHKFLSAGDFSVRLTVTNSFGLQASSSTNVRVEEPLAPSARLTAGPTSGRVPLKVTLDGSNSTDQNDPALGGSNLSWSWRLGDGTVLDPIAGTPAEGNVAVQRGPASGPFEVTFNKPGVYVLEMIVTNGFGKTDTEIVDVRVSGPPPDQPPVAVIRAAPRTGSGPLTVEFSADESVDPEGGLLEYTWNFGDGSQLVRGVSVVSHTYTREQTYNATLTVTDESGQSDDAAIAIVVTDDQGSNNGSPIARITTSATQGAAPFTVAFDASASSDPEGGNLSYAWDFGDGSDTAFGPQVEHVFREARNYSVVLVVSDSDGNTGAANVTISVTLPADDSGQDSPDLAPTSPPAPFCGGFGMFPVLLTLAGAIGVWKRLGGRTVR